MFGKRKKRESAVATLPKAKKSFDKRKLIGALFLAASMTVAFVILPMLYSAKDTTEKVYCSSQAINRGDEITEDKLSLKEVGTYGMSGYFTEEDKEKLIGEHASYDIVRGDIITKEKLGGTAAETITQFTKQGKFIYTASIKTNAQGVATHLKSGDTVNIMTFEEGEYGSNEVKLLLSNVYVYSADNSSGYSTDDTLAKDEQFVATVTFVLDSMDEVTALYRAEVSNGIHLVITGRS